MVICNYVVRERGVKKFVYISDVKKICFDLVLVNGEDLINYREFFGWVYFLLLERFIFLVERLGMDENFLDVIEFVKLCELVLLFGRREYVGGLYVSRVENCKDKVWLLNCIIVCIVSFFVWVLRVSFGKKWVVKLWGVWRFVFKMGCYKVIIVKFYKMYCNK